MIGVEALVAIVGSVGTAGAGVVAYINKRFTVNDKRHNELKLDVTKKLDKAEVKELVGDKLAPIHILLQEIKEDIKEIKYK